MLRPRPVPLPTSLVVKNGSKARAATSGGHAAAGVGHGDHDIVAGPRVAVDVAHRPRRAAHCATSTVSLPPIGMASRALSARLSSADVELAGIDAGRPQVRRRAGIRTRYARRACAAAAAPCRRPSGRCRSSSASAAACARRRAGCCVSRSRARRPSRCSRRCRAVRRRAASRLGEVLRVAEDDGQQIVEVMRDAAGELAHRLHLLGLVSF